MAGISSTFSPQRILIIKPSAIGDIVHALPVLARVRKRWPAAHIAWMVTPACAGLIDRHPLIDETILFHRRRFEGFWYNPRALRDLLRFFRELRAKDFDLVIDLQGLLRSAYSARETRAAVRIGFANAREGAPFFYTHRVQCSWEKDHAVQRYLKIADALGCADDRVEFPLAVDDEDRAAVAEMLEPGARYAVLLPGTNWETKRWPVEKFASLVAPLQERFGLISVAAGGRTDAQMCEKIGAPINLCGKTTLRQIVALLERAELVIANDSGPMHIAAALGRPLVATYGPTSEIRTGPFGRMDSVIRTDISCSPCYSRHCSHQSCLRNLEIDPVLELVERQLNRNNRLHVLPL